MAYLLILLAALAIKYGMWARAKRRAIGYARLYRQHHSEYQPPTWTYPEQQDPCEP